MYEYLSYDLNTIIVSKPKNEKKSLKEFTGKLFTGIDGVIAECILRLGLEVLKHARDEKSRPSSHRSTAQAAPVFFLPLHRRPSHLAAAPGEKSLPPPRQEQGTTKSVPLLPLLPIFSSSIFLRPLSVSRLLSLSPATHDAAAVGAPTPRSAVGVGVDSLGVLTVKIVGV
ncbi:hypothetical protein Tsubulata_040098 [Turnera subulata]|uniref:Uncharacterized protein n=1 Tax=Turnera subulata TaxID=218843 RepID=A0A9Q0JJF9_9ROSI|nr:hypothetical protein Tsubulata_040098 [Turnera subulata]